MAQIRIQRSVKLEDIENYYKELYDHMSTDVVVDLLLPKQLDNYYLGLVPALYQFGITWVRHRQSGKLLLDIDDPDATDFERIYENELVFPLVSLVWNKNEVFDKNGNTNLRRYLKGFNQKIFEKMRGGKQATLFSGASPVALKGSNLLLTEFDHLPKFHGTLPCFEVNGEFVQNEATFAENIISGIKDVLKYSTDIQYNFRDASSDLIGIVYELMKNTFEWAKEDENRVPLDPSLRGLLIRFYKKRRPTFIEDFQNHQGLLSYFTSDRLHENSQGEIYCLELSVFDSGVGFVDKFKSLVKSEGLSDIDIVKKCLIKHNTAAKGLEKDDKGMGLDRILNILNGKGFLRIKTGGVCVYRNLITQPYKKVENLNAQEMELFDWGKGSNSEYTSYPKAKGSVVTIIYPLSTTPPNE